MKKLFSFMVLIALAESGCLRSDVYFKNYTPDQEIQIKDDMHFKRLSFYGFGYWPEEHVLRSSELCPPGTTVSRVLTEIGFFDGFLSAVTLNIYTPRSLFAACAGDAKNASH
jgi:hypothetical protein